MKFLYFTLLSIKRHFFQLQHFFLAFFFSLKEQYNLHSKYLKVGVLIIGITIITFLLGLSFFHCCILVLFITIILCVLPFIRENYKHFPDNLGLLGLFIFISVYTLTNSVMTPEFQTNYPNLSEIDIFLIYLGTARIIIGITLTKNEMSYFDRIKTIVKEY